MEFGTHREWGTSWRLSNNRMEKEELKKLRVNRMSSRERVREWCASVVRRLLLFGVPLLLSMVMVVVLVIIYVLRPYSLTRHFTRTTCRVLSYDIRNGTYASCSAGTDPFQPCIKVLVQYPTGTAHDFLNGVIMENEQALVNCNLCSYTFGGHGLIHNYQEPCGSWKEDFNPMSCVNDFVTKYAVIGSTFTCYFNPNNPEQIVRDLALDMNNLIHMFSWPILACLTYLLAWAFVCYDAKRCRLMDEYIMEELVYQHEKRKAAQVQVNEWKKRKLSHTLGVSNNSDVRNGNIAGYVGSFDGGSKHLSTSLPSLCNLSTVGVHVSVLDLSHSTGSIQDLPFDVGDEEHFDLRHLDLAVSEQNIHDLTTTYPFVDGINHAVAMDDDHQFTNPASVAAWCLPAMGNSVPRSLIAARSPRRPFLFPGGEVASDVCHSEHGCSVSPRLTEKNSDRNRVLWHPKSRSFAPECISGHVNASVMSEEEVDSYYSMLHRPTRPQESWESSGGIQIVNMFSANDESKV